MDQGTIPRNQASPQGLLEARRLSMSDLRVRNPNCICFTRPERPHGLFAKYSSVWHNPNVALTELARHPPGNDKSELPPRQNTPAQPPNSAQSSADKCRSPPLLSRASAGSEFAAARRRSRRGISPPPTKNAHCAEDAPSIRGIKPRRRGSALLGA